MKALIIGYGSIGMRHYRVLTELGLEVSIVSRRPLHMKRFYENIGQALSMDTFDYIVIANETAAHSQSLEEIVNCSFKGYILVEKPLFMHAKFMEFNCDKTFVAYNLRFHPLIEMLGKLLQDDQVISVNAYAGQYLPSWRPDTDYTKSYSAVREQGGGVLRDLSHELDYLTMLFGEWHSLVAQTGKISDLIIQTEDYVSVQYKTKQEAYITLELNYLDRITQRYVIVQTDSKTIKIDLINNTINCNGVVEQTSGLQRDDTYREQHKAILNGTIKCCSYLEGLKIMKMIDAIENSASLRGWVYNE